MLQGSVIGPILYLIYACDIRKIKFNTLATFTDDTATKAVRNNVEKATKELKIALIIK